MAAGMTLPHLHSTSPDDQHTAPPPASFPSGPAMADTTASYAPPYYANYIMQTKSLTQDYSADPLPFNYRYSTFPPSLPRDHEHRGYPFPPKDDDINQSRTYSRLPSYPSVEPTFPRASFAPATSLTSIPTLPSAFLPSSSSSYYYDSAPIKKQEPPEQDDYGVVGSLESASQEAVIKLKTPLKRKYWRNGRRNLQCFPTCKVYGDYSDIKLEDLKQHDFMWGKCRGSVVTEVTLNTNVNFDDVLLLARVHSLENLPVPFEEAVVRECMLGRIVEPDVMDAMKEAWITGERLPDFVQQDAHVASFEFKPKVWKYAEDMAQGKCKRRNVQYYVQFEAFVLMRSGERSYFACIGSGMSTPFEVGSSRVLARQKRKAAAKKEDERQSPLTPHYSFYNQSQSRGYVGYEAMGYTGQLEASDDAAIAAGQLLNVGSKRRFSEVEREDVEWKNGSKSARQPSLQSV